MAVAVEVIMLVARGGSDGVENKGKKVMSTFELSGHQAGAYPGFNSMKLLGVFLLPPGWDASPLQGYPQF